MEENKKYTLDEAHRYFGVEYNNRVFALAEKKELTKDEALEIVHSAHASLQHWEKFSGHQKVNTQRGLYMIAKAYVVIEDKYNAMHFALLCIDFTKLHIGEMKDFDIFYANEMMARTAALVGKKTLFEECYTQAKEQLSLIKNPEDLKWANKDFEAGNWFGFV